MEKHFDVRSIVIYLGIFGVSLFFLYLAELRLFKSDRILSQKKERYVGLLLLGFGLLLPCLFAAFRGLTVGRDVDTYIIDNFKYGQIEGVSFSQFRKHVQLQIPEFLFALLMYISCRIGSIQFLLFIIQVLILVPLTYSIVKTKSQGSIVLAFALYYLLFYNFSLSGMRQSIAMSFLSVAIVLLLDKKYLKSIFFVGVAQLFHSSVFLIVTMILGCFLVVKSKQHTILGLLFVVLLVIAFFSFSLYADKLAGIVGRLNPRYAYFIRHYFHNGLDLKEIPSTDIVFKSALVILPYGISHRKWKDMTIDRLLMMFVLLGRYFVLFNAVFFESMRIAYYFDLFLTFYISRSVMFIHKKINKLIISFTYIMLAFVYWLYYIMYIGGYGTNLVIFNF